MFGNGSLDGNAQFQLELGYGYNLLSLEFLQMFGSPDGNAQFQLPAGNRNVSFPVEKSCFYGNLIGYPSEQIIS